MTWFGKRPRRLNYAVNKKRISNVWKVENAIKHYKTLQERVEVEWNTKWLQNAFWIVWKKLKKYGIKTNKI